jgi:hypothetical protein
MISDERKVEIETWDINYLIEKGTQLQEQANSTYEEVKLIKFLLLKHMRETNATMLAHPMVECKAKKELTSWNYNLLKPILELLDQSDIEAFYQPARWGEAPWLEEKFDMRVGKGFLKYGGDVKQIIEDATVQGEIKDITLKRKEI